MPDAAGWRPSGPSACSAARSPRPAWPPRPAGTDLVVLDNFDDNLSGQEGQRAVRDPALAAVLAGWTGKLLITCGAPFTVPGAPPHQSHQPHQREPHDPFVFRHLGPLTRSGAAELALSLPALRQVGEPQRELAWRLTAGHPRAMEYLDSLLAAGLRFDDSAGRVTAAVQARIGWPPASTEPTELSEATAEVIAMTAGQQLLGELFDRLSLGAQDLMVRASVFRTPVTPGALAARPADLAEGRAAGLLTPGPAATSASTAGPRLNCTAAWPRRARPRGWPLPTATPPATGTPAPPPPSSARAHSWRRPITSARPATWPPIQPSRPPAPAHPERRSPAAVCGVCAWPPRRASPRPSWPSRRSPACPPPISPRPNGRAIRPSPPRSPRPARSATRPRPGWPARSARAPSSPATRSMCSVLAGHGLPAANLLVLGPGAPDPLGSAVVLATSAARAMFGGRLASVYAPQTLASFGSGEARIDVRAVAADGSAAYRTALAADVRGRRAAGLQLLADPRVTISAPARAALAAGRVDARLLITLAALAANEPVQILAFGDDGPGASAGAPLRTAEITGAAAAARAMLAFVRAQRPPFLPARSAVSAGPGGPGPRPC